MTTAETEEQRATVTTLETRLDSEEAALTAAEKWDEQQQRLQARLTTETLTEQAPRQQSSRQRRRRRSPKCRERGEIVLTREFLGDMLNSRERPWDAEYRIAVARSVIDEEISRAMLRTDASDAMYRPSAEAQRALADLQIRYEHGRPGRLS